MRSTRGVQIIPCAVHALAAKVRTVVGGGEYPNAHYCTFVWGGVVAF